MISVVMATYNGEKYLATQLDSIINQSVQINELVIVDDCSSDLTCSIIEWYQKAYGFIKLIRNFSNCGVVKTFEIGLSCCTGDYIFLSDQDDIWFPDKVKVMIAKIGENLLIHSDAQLINAEGEIISKSFSDDFKDMKLVTFADFLIGNIVTGCCCMVTRELVNMGLPFPSGLFMHDHYFAQVASSLDKIKYINNKLVYYRQHSTNVLGVGRNGKLYIDEKYYQNMLRQLNALNRHHLLRKKDLKSAIEYTNCILNGTVTWRVIAWSICFFGVKRTIGLVIKILFKNLRKLYEKL